MLETIEKIIRYTSDYRNIIAHHYFGINVDIVWQIIRNDLPRLKGDLNVLLNK